MGQTTVAAVTAKFSDWAEGPKSPGLIVLEHETSNTSVQLFIDAVPVLEAAGWKWASVAQITEGHVDPHGAYLNVDDDGYVSAGVVSELSGYDDSDADEPSSGTDSTAGNEVAGSDETTSPPKEADRDGSETTNPPKGVDQDDKNLKTTPEESSALSVTSSTRILVSAFVVGAFWNL